MIKEKWFLRIWTKKELELIKDIDKELKSDNILKTIKKI